MVAAAAQLGRCHQAEVQAALSEGVPTAERRKILRVALLGAAALLPSTEASAADDQGVASSRMSYSRFLVRLSPARPPPISEPCAWFKDIANMSLLFFCRNTLTWDE